MKKSMLAFLPLTAALFCLSTGAALSGDVPVIGRMRYSFVPTADDDVTNKAYVDGVAAVKADIASPAFAGTPTAPTAAATVSNDQIATTANVDAKLNEKITYDTTDLTAGTSSLATGNVYLVYE